MVGGRICKSPLHPLERGEKGEFILQAVPMMKDVLLTFRDPRAVWVHFPKLQGSRVMGESNFQPVRCQICQVHGLTLRNKVTNQRRKLGKCYQKLGGED